jgi:hypothetical protein
MHFSRRTRLELVSNFIQTPHSRAAHVLYASLDASELKRPIAQPESDIQDQLEKGK